MILFYKMISHLYFCDSFVNLLKRSLWIAGRCLWALCCSQGLSRSCSLIWQALGASLLLTYKFGRPQGFKSVQSSGFVWQIAGKVAKISFLFPAPPCRHLLCNSWTAKPAGWADQPTRDGGTHLRMCLRGEHGGAAGLVVGPDGVKSLFQLYRFNDCKSKRSEGWIMFLCCMFLQWKWTHFHLYTYHYIQKIKSALWEDLFIY